MKLIWKGDREYYLKIQKALRECVNWEICDTAFCIGLDAALTNYIQHDLYDTKARSYI